MRDDERFARALRRQGGDMRKPADLSGADEFCAFDLLLVAEFERGLPIRVVAERARVETDRVCDAIRRARRAGVIAGLGAPS